MATGRMVEKKGGGGRALRPSLLLISDEAARVDRLYHAVNLPWVETTRVEGLSELATALHRAYTLAVIDLAPVNLPRALVEIREKPAHEFLPVIVESSRLRTDRGFASTLATYRAMPCCLGDLAALTRFYLGQGDTAARREGFDYHPLI